MCFNFLRGLRAVPLCKEPSKVTRETLLVWCVSLRAGERKQTPPVEGSRTIKSEVSHQGSGWKVFLKGKGEEERKKGCIRRVCVRGC